MLPTGNPMPLLFQDLVARSRPQVTLFGTLSALDPVLWAGGGWHGVRSSVIRLLDSSEPERGGRERSPSFCFPDEFAGFVRRSSCTAPTGEAARSVDPGGAFALPCCGSAIFHAGMAGSC